MKKRRNNPFTIVFHLIQINFTWELRRRGWWWRQRRWMKFLEECGAKLNRVYEFGSFARAKKKMIYHVRRRADRLVHTQTTHQLLWELKLHDREIYQEKCGVRDWTGPNEVFFSVFFFLFLSFSLSNVETLWQSAWSGNYNNLFRSKIVRGKM